MSLIRKISIATLKELEAIENEEVRGEKLE